MTAHRLVIDAQTLQSRQFGERGIPRYTTDFCRSLLKARGPVAAVALNPVLPPPHRLHHELARAPELQWSTAAMFERLGRGGPLAYHVMSPFEGPRPVQNTLPSYALGNGVPLVITVYDLIPEIFKVFPPGSTFERVYHMRRDLLRRADLLVAISESSANDAMELLQVGSDRVAVIGTGASDFFRPPLEGERPEAVLAQHVPAITRPFVMGVTGVFGLDTRKNTEALIDAFGRLPEDVRRSHQLVVACRLTPEAAANWMRLAAERGLDPDSLVLTGFVLDVVLRALYQRAALFVYPSLYEGFGLPALEAARCGCPTITSNTSSMPEIMEWPPSTFTPTNAEEITAAMERALTDEPFRAELRDRGLAAGRRHTWERVAERAMKAYGRLDQRPARRRRRPLRVAMVGPLPPARTGIAGYNARLAGHMANQCELDYFTEHEAGSPRGEPAPYRRFSASAFARRLNPASYDAVFYTFGNSVHHHQAYQLAMWYPGIAWFHDVQLAELYLSFGQSRMPEDDVREHMRSALRHQYGERAPEYVVDSENWRSHQSYEQAGVRLCTEVVSKARGVVVTSGLARAAVTLDAGPYNLVPPTWVVPLAVPTVAATSRGGDSGPALGTGPPVVVAIGTVSQVKQPELLIEAMAVVNQEMPACLVFVGHVEDQYRRRLDRLAREFGVEGRVELAGFPDRPDDTEARLGSAAMAVQLRAGNSGASSTGLAEALGHGLPVVTNASAATELPSGTVHLVTPDLTPGSLALDIRRVLGDGAFRERLRAGALDYARSATFDHAAAQMLDIARWNRGR